MDNIVKSIERLLSKGANGYVVKPMASDEFEQAIQNLGLYWIVLN